MPITLIKDSTNIDFVSKRKFSYALSGLILLAGLVFIILNGGLRYGVDFSGGVMSQIRFTNPVTSEDVAKAVDPIDMPGLVVQAVGADNLEYMLRFSVEEEGATQGLRAELEAALAIAFPDQDVEIDRLEMVGPKVGAELRDMAVEALFYAILLTIVYIAGRFENSWFLAGGVALALWLFISGWGWLFAKGWLPLNKLWAVGISIVAVSIALKKLNLNFSLGSIVSLLHDVFITIMIITIVGIEIDLNIIAAILTIVGYSLNDTIIVFDRIRENIKAIPDNLSDDQLPGMETVINKSLNQTLSRTILTSGTTLLACLSLYLLGGSVIHDFAFTILIGIIVGTYSSIFVASPALLSFGDTKQYRDSLKPKESYERPGEHGVV